MAVFYSRYDNVLLNQFKKAQVWLKANLCTEAPIILDWLPNTALINNNHLER
jgi:hypothetical protein